MKVILATYKSIGWIVPVYEHLHNKYWGAPVALLAEGDYSGGKFEFYRPPDEIGTPKNGEYPPWRYTDILAWYLRQITDEYVIIMMADYLIYRPVDVVRLVQLEEYMSENAPILRGQVGDDGGYRSGQMVDTYKDIEIWEGHFLPSSLTPGMWNRELLLSIMPLNCEPWGFEHQLHQVIVANRLRSIAPAPGILRYVNAFRGRNMKEIVITEALYKEVGGMLQVKPGRFAPERK